jgi:hypothetical protein
MTPLMPQIAATHVGKEREAQAGAMQKEATREEIQGTRQKTTHLSQLVFEFCKADWNSKRYQLLKKEAEEKRHFYHTQLVPFVNVPAHLQPNNVWKIDLSTLSKEQLEEIGGAGYIELHTRSKSKLTVVERLPTGLPTILEGKKTDHEVIKHWFENTSGHDVEKSIRFHLFDRFHMSDAEIAAFLIRCAQPTSETTPITGTTIQVRRFAHGTNASVSSYVQSKKKRHGGNNENQHQNQNQNKKQKPCIRCAGERLSLEDANTFMFGLPTSLPH